MDADDNAYLRHWLRGDWRPDPDDDGDDDTDLYVDSGDPGA